MTKAEGSYTASSSQICPYGHFDRDIWFSILLVNLYAIQELVDVFGRLVHIKQQQNVNAAFSSMNK